MAITYICCGHTYAKYLAKRVERIPLLLNLLAYSEIIGYEKTKKKLIFNVSKMIFSRSEECKDS